MRATHAEHVFVEAPVPLSWVTAPPRAPLHYLCTRSAACRECPHRAAQNACSRARCAARAPLLYPRTTALPVRRCPACAPEARRVVNALAEGIEMPARAPDAGSRSHSHFHMRVRAAIPTPICGFAQPIPTHTCKPARAAFSTPGFPAIARPYSRFPGSPASDSRFPGRNGRHRAGIRRETWNPQRKRPGPSHPEGQHDLRRLIEARPQALTQKTNPRQTQRWPLGSSERPPHHVKGSRLTKNAPAHPQRRRTTTSGSPSPVVVRTLSMPRV